MRTDDLETGDGDDLKTLARICPAGCYTLRADGSVDVDTAGCMQCGACPASGLRDRRPTPGGYGLLFRVG
ncbi:hypothetical protein RGUI_2006 [Rhodovulum sp. P5]|uniref:hypothetical protein n=1 Tax=Rhodovulum sp. P5 TaxID=1564506 RepID=UPI0009C37C48|nr:hypothetical protein [Rhodovulum sp. P5]ARE40147.1 hypothetical protein RGUI_2006 [Rhodovulum sp. P5]